MHNYFGPGTHVEDRIYRGDKPINLFDRAAMIHDVEYFNGNQFKADNNMWQNIAKQGYLYQPIANIIRMGFLLKDIVGYDEAGTNKEKYEILKSYVKKHYDLQGMEFY